LSHSAWKTDTHSAHGTYPHHGYRLFSFGYSLFSRLEVGPFPLTYLSTYLSSAMSYARLENQPEFDAGAASTWACASCTFANPPNNVLCSMCHTPKQERLASAPPASVHTPPPLYTSVAVDPAPPLVPTYAPHVLQPSIVLPPGSGMWACGVCTLQNVPSVIQCSACGSAKPPPQQQPPQLMYSQPQYSYTTQQQPPYPPVYPGQQPVYPQAMFVQSDIVIKYDQR
jgi:hypothetical protein